MGTSEATMSDTGMRAADAGALQLRSTAEKLAAAVDRDTWHVRQLIHDAMECMRVADKRCGVYILFDGRKPVYVGQAQCVGQRIAQHLKYKTFDRYAVIECDRVRLLSLERDVITILNPPLNRCGGERINGQIVPLRPMKFRR